MSERWTSLRVDELPSIKVAGDFAGSRSATLRIERSV
jgi:hypothetical protein